MVLAQLVVGTVVGAAAPVGDSAGGPRAGMARDAAAVQRPAPVAVPTGPLSGVTIGIDPGHNGRNWTDPSYLARQVWNGREWEDCDTTGAQTQAGYPEPRFTWRVGRDLAAILRARGARVVLTRHSNTGIGPCVTRRARILDRAHAAVSIDLHADGAPPSGRGFALLLPVRDRVNRHVVASSRSFARDLRRSFLTTGMPLSTYDGVRGLQPRANLAGLNLTTMPKVLIDCGNMANPVDARMLTSGRWQHRAARAIAAAMARFLRSGAGNTVRPPGV